MTEEELERLKQMQVFQNPQLNALRGPPTSTPQGPIAPDLSNPNAFRYQKPVYTPEEQAALDRAQQAKINTTAKQLWTQDNKGQGRGIIGALVKSRKLKARPEQMQEKYIPMATQMVESAKELSDIETRTGATADERRVLFEKSLDRQIDSEERKGTKTYYSQTTGAPLTVNFDRTGAAFKPGTNNPVDLDGYVDQYPKDFLEAKNKKDAKSAVSNKLDRIVGNYLTMASRGEAITSDQDLLTNVKNYALSNPMIAEIDAATGSERGAIKKEIVLLSRSLMNDIRQASEMGVRGMDTPKELEFYMSILGNPQTNLTTALATLLEINAGIGRGPESLGELGNLAAAEGIVEARNRIRAQRDGKGSYVERALGTGLTKSRSGADAAPMGVDTSPRPPDNPELDALRKRLAELEAMGGP